MIEIPHSLSRVPIALLQKLVGSSSTQEPRVTWLTIVANSRITLSSTNQRKYGTEMDIYWTQLVSVSSKSTQWWVIINQLRLLCMMCSTFLQWIFPRCVLQQFMASLFSSVRVDVVKKKYRLWGSVPLDCHQRLLPPNHTSISVLQHPVIRSNNTKTISVLIKIQRIIHQQSTFSGLNIEKKYAKNIYARLNKKLSTTIRLPPANRHKFIDSIIIYYQSKPSNCRSFNSLQWD